MLIAFYLCILFKFADNVDVAIVIEMLLNVWLTINHIIANMLCFVKIFKKLLLPTHLVFFKGVQKIFFSEHK